MATFKRPLVKSSEVHEGAAISFHALPPDVEVCIDGETFGVYLDVNSGRMTARRYIEKHLKKKV